MTPRSPARRPIRRPGDVLRWMPQGRARSGSVPHRHEVIALLIVEAIIAGKSELDAIIGHVCADVVLGADDEDVIEVGKRIATAFAAVGIPTTARSPVAQLSPSTPSRMESGP